MYSKLILYFNSLLSSPIDSEEIRLIKEIFKHRTVLKNQFFIQEGDVNKLTGFIVKGSFKQFYLDEKGEEKITDLFIENCWIRNNESILKNIPSSYYIQAYRRSEILVVTQEDAEKYLLNEPFIIEICRILLEKKSIQLLKHIYINSLPVAKQKIKELENSRPEFFQEFPQHLIASYLGLTKETYSRIRNGIQKTNKLF
ncbi:Crp/Fnr family transcriptional regulator [Chryseobacterium gambrini]|uniref:Crp/Fnr family transcriptional regulator n=1 Tax=Chryseobacterium gambrini TaxID=373672 RepID=UPI0022F177B3|nr:Crp/Fnr family transcriptional regulator [Chryseobacterium gambrini]WBV53858.1 Crp/Fnr family transcriptional regulator [Chryseobacterium gambrini]